MIQLFLQFICRYWIIIALGGAFYSGYHLKGLQVSVVENKRLIDSVGQYNEVSGNYEKSKTEIEQLYEKIEPVDNANCIIPDNGLRILREATKAR